MQYFKNWTLFFSAIVFWIIFFGFILLAHFLFFSAPKNHSIVYDITEGGLKDQLHIETAKILTNVEKGKIIFKQCAVCHSLNKNQTQLGPSLYHIVDKQIAKETGFAYSGAMLKFAANKKKWTIKQLNLYLSNPQKLVPGNRMSFVGLANKQDRKNLLLYLSQAQK